MRVREEGRLETDTTKQGKAACTLPGFEHRPGFDVIFGTRFNVSRRHTYITLYEPTSTLRPVETEARVQALVLYAALASQSDVCRKMSSKHGQLTQMPTGLMVVY
jgi:hypothetical protein